MEQIKAIIVDDFYKKTPETIGYVPIKKEVWNNSIEIIKWYNCNYDENEIEQKWNIKHQITACNVGYKIVFRDYLFSHTNTEQYTRKVENLYSMVVNAIKRHDNFIENEINRLRFKITSFKELLIKEFGENDTLVKDYIEHFNKHEEQTF